MFQIIQYLKVPLQNCNVFINFYSLANFYLSSNIHKISENQILYIQG